MDFIAKDDFDIKTNERRRKKFAHTSHSRREYILIASDICDWYNVKCSVMGYAVLIDAACDAISYVQMCLVCIFLLWMTEMMKPFKKAVPYSRSLTLDTNNATTFVRI